MKKKISSMGHLEKALQPVMVGMVGEMEDRVYRTLNHFLQEYYGSYDPEYYRRQFDFLRSAVKTEPKVMRGRIVASVYIDHMYMCNYYNASGLQVASWANQGLHGGKIPGRNTPHVWDDTMDAAVNNGELLKLAVEYLRGKGFSVKV